MKALEKIKEEAMSLYIDCLVAAMTPQGKHSIRTSFGVGAFIGTVPGGVAVAFADDDIAGFGKQVLGIVQEIYDAVFSVVTALAAVLAIIALIVRMSGNQQRAAQATQWLIRIISAYIAINCLGIITKVIDRTTEDYRFTK